MYLCALCVLVVAYLLLLRRLLLRKLLGPLFHHSRSLCQLFSYDRCRFLLWLRLQWCVGPEVWLLFRFRLCCSRLLFRFRLWCGLLMFRFRLCCRLLILGRLKFRLLLLRLWLSGVDMRRFFFLPLFSLHLSSGSRRLWPWRPLFLRAVFQSLSRKQY